MGIADEPNGTKEWRDEEGQLHRENGPALITWFTPVDTPCICEKWYRHGKLHREDGPAFQHLSNGVAQYESWWIDGKMHRDGAPARISGSVDKRWFLHGKIHRVEGPAWEIAGRFQFWYVNGQPHNENGPAKVYYSTVSRDVTFQEWWVNGRRHRIDGPAVLSATDEQWYQRGKLHREGGPASITDVSNNNPLGLKKWYRHGRLHRIDGPAVEYPNGSKEYWLNGKLHRSDGPAVEAAEGFLIFHYMNFRSDGRETEKWLAEQRGKALDMMHSKEYWIAGRLLCETEFREREKKLERRKACDLARAKYRK